MTSIVWKVLFCSLTSKMIQVSEKKIFSRKTTNKQSWKFTKIKFLPKPNMRNSANTKSKFKVWTLKPLTETLTRIDPDITKHFRTQAVSGKIFGTKWRNPMKLEMTRKFWYLSFYTFWLLHFHCYCSSLISYRKTKR